MQALHRLFEEAVITEPLQAEGLQVFGIRWDPGSQLDYLTIDQALAGGRFEIKEVSEAGSVPTLLVNNETGGLVLLMAGEHLVGAKQDRVANASIMIATGSGLRVPVSCVEQGRWGYRSHRFSSSGSSSHGHLRKMMLFQATEGYRLSGRPTTSQHEVWSEVRRKLGKLGSLSPSSALHQAYRDHEGSLRKMLEPVRVPPDCNGVVFAFGGRIAGADIFDKPSVLQRLLPKIVRAYALDALEEEQDGQVDVASVESWFRSAPSAGFERYDSPGLGDDVRFESPELIGAALLVEECPVHVELFPNDRKDPGRTVRRPGPQASTPPVVSPPGRTGVVAIATSEALLHALGEALRALAPVFAARGVPLYRSGRLIRIQDDEHERFDGSNPVFAHAEECALVRNAREREPRASVRVVLTGCGLADNWFSHWHDESRTAVVSAYDWSLVSRSPLAAGVAAAVVLHGWRMICPGHDPDALFHDETRGCLFDLCREKTEVDRKLLAGDLCHDCRERLVAAGVAVEPILRALAAVRGLARTTDI